MWGRKHLDCYSFPIRHKAISLPNKYQTTSCLIFIPLLKSNQIISFPSHGWCSNSLISLVALIYNLLQYCDIPLEMGKQTERCWDVLTKHLKNIKWLFEYLSGAFKKHNWWWLLSQFPEAKKPYISKRGKTDEGGGINDEHHIFFYGDVPSFWGYGRRQIS